ncbi:ryanodine receptor [Brachionus plicatilis]|uniref:Ryanodine receptor n=1 Tax=Brachionus plicatilis TaxID=10195 RepID=A0A3M7Q4L9_BRAPC|nr:ryanodine receptor [Brachionus plicatilis]
MRTRRIFVQFVFEFHNTAGEIQLASYKILNALWILGTLGTKLVDREWIVSDLSRHRPLIGECLGSFATSFPIAFLEPEFNLNNKHSIMYGLTESNLSEHSLEAQDVMAKLSKNLPLLDDIISEIGHLCESGGKYEDAPHVIEILLPTLCSYLHHWWDHGPSAKLPIETSTATTTTTTTTQKKPETTSETGAITGVTSQIMNKTLGYILKLISNNLDEKEAAWMNRIASFSQLIIANSTSDLLEHNFLPVSGLIAQKARHLYHKEVSIRTHSKNAAQRENIESDVQRQLEIIIRNIYAFYPLLIKYVDLHRAHWLKHPDEKSQQLYYHVAEVFTIWLKSKMFKREETNFVSANNIDNMLLIMPNKVSGLSSPTDVDATGSKTKKKRAKSHKSQTKKFTSLIVAGLKRLFQLGINFFEGKEQELIQMAKQKFIDIKTGLLSETLTINGKKVSTVASTISQEDTPNLELSKDQEEIVADFITRYLKSSHLTSKDDSSVNDTIDKETYQKTKWQRVLYRKIASKRHLISTMRNLSQESIVEKIMEVAKVLYGLHMVEHPQTKAKGIWRKLISGQRKKAVMACFRMAPLYSLPHHRAINLFLKAYRQNWLDMEAENQTDIGWLVPDLCPKMAKVDELEAGEDVQAVQVLRPDPLTQLIACFNRAATTQQTGAHGSANLADDQLYQMFADKMSKSCEIVDDEDEEEEEHEEQAASDDDQSSAFQLAEMQKQKLLFEQDRLAERGAAQMCLLYISASRGEKTQMLEKTLELGISLLHGGNVHVQQRMLKHLRDKKDVGFFTSLAGLMANCSVLDLDTFERCIKAEQFGGLTASDSESGMAGKKNLHDADFTCALFRFLQLLCEGHNLEFQNYLRAQAGNNTTVNIIICTVDYLLRLQESLMDFYWHYSGKSTVDAAGKDNFCRAINVAKQVFNTLTEYIQGPCVGNQLTLAHSRLWDAIGGFLYIFANLQDKLSKDPLQIELLRELMKLQKDMIIMLLSMLEGNVLNGPIGKQMVDTLIENQPNVEMLLKFFDIFLKMKDLTTSEAFQEFDANGDGWISPKEFRRAMEAQKMYSCEEIDYILMCVDTNQDGKIDFNEFTERFHNPAKDIGFNMAVLLTNLSEHMSHEPRFERLMKKASSFLSYFEPFLGRIEITGSSGRIERVYFQIKESNIEQWNKPQIKESKRQFLYDIVNEGDDKEKLEQFVNFCEDTIFEMQHAASISSSGEDQCQSQEGNKQSVLKSAFQMAKTGLMYSMDTLSPNRLKTFCGKFGNMGKMEVVKWCAQIGFGGAVFLVALLFHLVCLVFKCVYLMVSGESGAKSDERRMSADGKSRRAEEVVEERQSRRELELVDEREECESGESGESGEIGESGESRAAVVRDEDDEVIVSTSGPVHGPSSSGGKKILAMFARNFYKLKYLALILAFLINFLMLFYKAKKLNLETMAELADDDDIDETNLIEVIMVDQDEYYIEHLLKSLACVHSLVAFGIMVAYYVLKVPLVIFKREKEIARKLEFQGLWIAEQPDDDDLKSHWDKLVLGTRSFPDMYWDKFIKKKVKSKYAEQFDMQQLNKLLGIDAKFDEYNFDEVSKAAGQNPQNANESKSFISRQVVLYFFLLDIKKIKWELPVRNTIKIK